MRNIILLSISIAFTFYGCSGEDPPTQNKSIESILDSKEVKLIKEYELEDKFDGINKVFVREFNDSLICFSGQLNKSEKIGLVVFNTRTKSKLVDIIPIESPTIVVDKPYGEKETLSISAYGVDAFGDGDPLLLSFIVLPHHGDVRFWCFIKDGKVIKIIQHQYNQARFRKWGDGFLIRTGSLPPVAILYNPYGEEILNVKFLEVDKVFDSVILNDFEGISITLSLEMLRFDLREKNALWRTQIDLGDLNNPRIDNTKLIEKTDTHFTYEISYTEYSGKKGAIKFKVDIETGEVQYI